MIRALFTGRGLVATAAVIAGFLLLCRLGVWQLDRHNHRAAQNQVIVDQMALPAVPLDASAAPEALDYRHVSLRGVFDPSQEILLRNREYAGETGYDVLTPLHLSDGSGTVLVDRGWVPLIAQDPTQRAMYAAPTGEVQIDGVARRSQSDLGGPLDPPTGPLMPRLDAWFRVDIERIEEQTGYPLLRVFVEQQPGSEPAAAPPIPMPTESLGYGPHLGYAAQWFAFALILPVTYIVMVNRQLKDVAKRRAARQVAAEAAESSVQSS